VSVQIPTSEPQTLRAGDTWKWRREDLTSYPAGTWTLKYRFKNASGGFEVTATADGLNHAVSVSAATTAAYAAGQYDYVAWVAYSGEEYTIGSGRVTVEPDLRGTDATSALDIRTPARKILEKLEAAMLARDPTLAAYSIQTGNGSRSRTFATLAEVRIEYDHVRAEVAREDQAASIAAGNGNPRKLYVRFNRA
jgi:hypothetical protein